MINDRWSMYNDVRAVHYNIWSIVNFRWRMVNHWRSMDKDSVLFLSFLNGCLFFILACFRFMDSVFFIIIFQSCVAIAFYFGLSECISHRVKEMSVVYTINLCWLMKYYRGSVYNNWRSVYDNRGPVYEDGRTMHNHRRLVHYHRWLVKDVRWWMVHNRWLVNY